jgi:hypothetical protein
VFFCGFLLTETELPLLCSHSILRLLQYVNRDNIRANLWAQSDARAHRSVRWQDPHGRHRCGPVLVRIITTRIAAARA